MVVKCIQHKAPWTQTGPGGVRPWARQLSAAEADAEGGADGWRLALTALSPTWRVGVLRELSGAFLCPLPPQSNSELGIIILIVEETDSQREKMT